MNTFPPAVHRTIVCVDVEGFGDRSRTHPHQIAVRDGLYRALGTALTRSGIDWQDCYHEDRGDGVLILIPAEVPKKLLTASVLSELAAALAVHNQTHDQPSRIRLRVAVHAGEIHHDDHGLVGTAINLAFRLLEATQLKHALADSSGVLAMIASQWFYEEVIRHDPASIPASYRRVPISVKETKTTAWICLPDLPDAPEEDSTTTLSLPQQPQHSPVPRQLPAATSVFVGRQADLDDLDVLLTGDNAREAVVTSAIAGGAADRRLVALVGTGGVGKTALAVHWAHRIRGRFPDGQLWVDLRGYASAAPLRSADVVTRFLLALGFGADRLPAGAEEQFALLRTALTDKRLLMVLDNAHSAEQVRPLLPAAPGSFTLITSRNSLRGLVASNDALILDVAALQPVEARSLLGKLLSDSLEEAAPGGEQAGRILDLLARRCAYLPLALRIAAANITRDPGRDVAAYLAFRTGRELLDELTVEDDPDAAVRAAFASSYTALVPAQRRLFRRLGLAPGKDITVDAAAALDGIDIDAARALLGQLGSVHLVERRGGGRHQLHDLLRIYAAERAKEEEPEAEREAARRRLYDFGLHSVRQATTPISVFRMAAVPEPASVRPRTFANAGEAAEWLEAELPNLIAVIAAAAAEGPRAYAWQLVSALEFYFRATCAYETWRNVATTALEAARSEGRDAEIANLNISLGHACMESGSFIAAVGHGRAAHEHAVAAGWPEGRCWGLAVMGWAYGYTGQTRAAIDVLVRAVGLAQTHELHNARVVSTLHLGDAQLAGGRLAEAKDHYEEVLRRTSDSDILFRGLAFLGLGGALRHLGALDEAVARLDTAIRLLDPISARSGHAEALATQSLAYHDAGQDGLAREIALRAVDLARERHESGKLPAALLALASAYGTGSKAAGHYRQARAAARAADRPMQEVEALCGLARCLLRAGRTGSALAAAGRALHICREDEWQIQAGMAHTTMAEAQLAAGEAATAVRHGRHAVEITEYSGARLWHAHSLLALGRALSVAAGPTAALPTLSTARELLGELNAPQSDELQ